MLHPVGPQSPTIYWRRRLFFLASLALIAGLVALTVSAMMGSGGGSLAAGAPRSSSGGAASGSASSSHRAPSSRRPRHSSSPKSHDAVPAASVSTSTHSSAPPKSTTPTSSATSASTSAAASSSSSAALATCRPNDLQVAAVSQHPRYSVGQQPVLSLKVTNTGSGPCVQDLADPQIVLTVYNGESRVWGSHDCEIQKSVTDRTLMPGAPVLVSLRWSGLSSQPGCAGVRQRVGAGQYTLYARLAGKVGTAAQFAIR